MEHILLPALDEERTEVVTKEMLEVERIPSGLRLLHSPAYVDGLAGGDVIELAPELLCGFRLVTRGRNLAIVVVFAANDQRDAAHAVVSQAALQLGGVCDGGPDRMLVCTVPVTAGLAQVGTAFGALVQRHPGSTWYYGNVYGPDDEPLAWWKDA